MITRLVLENWRSHKNTEFDFSKGTNVLVGAMGSGKSSAMDAVSFALFGTFPALNQKKIRLDDMIMNKPERKNNAKVSMAFTVDGKEYSVKREIVRGKGQTSAEIRMGDKLIESANQRVNDRIGDILRIDYDLFSRAVYAEQNNIDYFLEIPKAKRREKIDELLKIDKFEAARKNLGTVMTRLAEMADDRKSAIANKPDISEIAALDKELANGLSELAKKEGALAAKKKEKESAESRYNSVLAKRAAFSEHDNKIKELNGQIKAFEQKLNSYGPMTISEDELKKRITGKAEERKQLKGMLDLKNRKEAERDTLSTVLSGHEKSLAEYERKLQDAKYDKNAPAKLKECKERAEETRKTLEDMAANYRSIDARLLEVEESISKLGKGIEKCHTCDSELDEATVRRLLQNRQHEKKLLSDNRAELEKRVLEFSELRKKLETELEGLQKAVNSIEEGEWLSGEKNRLAKDISAMKQNLNILVQQLGAMQIGRGEEELEKEIRGLEDMLDYFIYQKEFAQKAAEREKLKQELSRLGYKEEDEKKAYDSLKEIEKNAAVSAQELTNLSSLIAERGKRLDDLKRIQQEIEWNKKEIEHLNAAVDSYEILQKGLQDVQGKLRQEFTEETNAALTDVWKRLYPYADYRELKLVIDEAGDYILQLQRRDGGWINVEGTTSGGERSTACLALRIALSLVLTQNLSWLVLDEPTHNLDRQAVRELAVTLRDHLPKIVDQVFVITHEEELESAASGYLYRLQRNKEEDEPTKITAEQASA